MKTILTLISLLFTISFSLQAKIIPGLVASNEIGENKTITIHLNNFETHLDQEAIHQNFVDSPRLALFRNAYAKIARDGNVGHNNIKGSKNLEMLQVNEILKNFNRVKLDRKLKNYLNNRKVEKPGLIYFGTALIKKAEYMTPPICTYPTFRLPTNFE